MSREESFLQKYLRYVKTHESPTAFHVWCAIATIAIAASRRYWIDMGHYVVYPNQYIVLVAGSGACRKGGALSVARKIQDAVFSGNPQMIRLAGKFTPEAMTQLMVTDMLMLEDEGIPENASRPVDIHSAEFGVMINKMAQNTGLPDLLTDLWDCPDYWGYVTKTKGVDDLYKVCINILGATTPTWMLTNVTPGMMGDGFISRVMLVYAHSPEQRIPRGPRLDSKIFKQLVSMLAAISDNSGVFEFTDAGGELWDKWYIEAVDGTDSERTSGFIGRQHSHVLKSAMALSLSEDPFALKLDAKHIKSAIDLVTDVRTGIPHALGGADASEEQRHTIHVLNYIRKVKVVSALRLRQAMFKYMNGPSFDAAITELLRYGMITERGVADKDGKRVGAMYCEVEDVYLE